MDSSQVLFGDGINQNMFNNNKNKSLVSVFAAIIVLDGPTSYIITLINIYINHFLFSVYIR